MIHDPKLLEQLSALKAECYNGEVFRATRIGLDPLAFTSNGGRWAPKGEVAVLYTSLEREGALAEITYHWSQLDPLPSKPVALHRLKISTQKALRLLRANLEALGVREADYGMVNNPRTQVIGAAVAFLGHDGLIAPSARWPCDNLMLFNDNFEGAGTRQLIATDEIDWKTWGRDNGLLPSR